MALSFDQYRYFSAAWVRDHEKRSQVAPKPDQAVDDKTPPARRALPASITWLVPPPRAPLSNEPD